MHYCAWNRKKSSKSKQDFFPPCCLLWSLCVEWLNLFQAAFSLLWGIEPGLLLSDRLWLLIVLHCWNQLCPEVFFFLSPFHFSSISRRKRRTQAHPGRKKIPGNRMRFVGTHSFPHSSQQAAVYWPCLMSAHSVLETQWQARSAEADLEFSNTASVVRQWLSCLTNDLTLWSTYLSTPSIHPMWCQAVLWP